MKVGKLQHHFLGNAHNIAEGEDSIGEVIDGTYPMDEHWASGVLTEQKERDYKFQVMTLKLENHM